MRLRKAGLAVPELDTNDQHQARRDIAVYLPTTQSGTAIAADNAVEIVLSMQGSDGSIVQVRTTILAEQAGYLADSIGAAAEQAVAVRSGRKPA